MITVVKYSIGKNKIINTTIIIVQKVRRVKYAEHPGKEMVISATLNTKF